MKKVEELYRKQAMRDIEQGMTIEEVVRKYPVSVYYARKWSGTVYKKMDLDRLVRDRFKWVVGAACNDIEDMMSDTMYDDEAASISEETWELWSKNIRRRLYDMAKDIVRKN